jgi:threonine synthase
LRKSGGTAVSATDDETIQAVYEWASGEGSFAAPEGAASLAKLVGYHKLINAGFLEPSDRVVLFNTGSGLKYADVFKNYHGTEPLKPVQRGSIVGEVKARHMDRLQIYRHYMQQHRRKLVAMR